MAKLWGGRFEKAMAGEVFAFNASLGFDQRLMRHDLLGSLAHAEMLGRQGIITADEVARLVAGLTGILADWDAGQLPLDMACEDVHSFVEQTLVARVGDVGKKLHTGRSRNDQVATDFRLWLRDAIDDLSQAIADFQQTLASIAEAHYNTLMPGFTHLQPAQPVTLGYHLGAYGQMLLRDAERLADCRKRVNICPLGSGALAGNPYPIDRAWVAQKLGFDGMTANTMDAVSDRDFAVEFLADASLLMVHLSRLCEEVILWNTPAFGWITLDDAFSTGSSLMPQKKNPDIAELVRGKSGRVVGHLVGLLTTLKALPLAYNKDMQEDKEGVFDTVDTLQASLRCLDGMLATATFHPERMRHACKLGYLNATALADYLVGQGVPFRDAHHLVGQLVQQAQSQGVGLEDLSLAELQHVSPVIQDDVYDRLKLTFQGRVFE
jgi:argininosuccinate lyase